jgi:hypothetical protein
MVSPHDAECSVEGWVAVIRRVLRIALWVAFVSGVVMAFLKIRQARQPAAPAPTPDGGADAPWPRLQVDEPAPTREPEPAATAAPSEPEHEPEPAAKPEPEAKPKAAAKPEPAAKAKPKAAAKKAAPKGAAAPSAGDSAWVEPVEGVCPTTHPVKASLARRIFHIPGGLSYGRVIPDRCYRSPADAEADGLHQASR